MNCQIVEREGEFRCANCNTTFPRLGLKKTCRGPAILAAVEQRTNVTPKAGCGKTKPPSLLRKAANFGVAAISHAMKGNPTCTQEQIDARLAICATCEDNVNGECRECGCPLVRERIYLSKVAWADQSCPKKPPKWGPITEASGGS